MPNNEESKKDLKKDIKFYGSIEVLATTEGGENLQKVLLEDILSAITALTGQYTALSHIELIGIIASLKERLTVFRLITRAPINAGDALIELKKILKEETPEPLEPEK